jgi:polysaccharide biosynthesis protein PslH
LGSCQTAAHGGGRATGRAKGTAVKVLWATCHRPDPTGGGGAVHEFELVRAAARTHEVVVVSTGVRPGERLPELTAIGVETVGVAWPGPRPFGSRAAVLKRLATQATPSVVWRMEPAAAALSHAVAEYEEGHRVDVVSVWPSEMGAVAASTVAPSSLILADCYTRQAERELQQSRAIRHRVYWSFEAKNARRWEAATYARASAVACVSPLDAEVLVRLIGRDIDAVPLALADDWFSPPAQPRGADVVFVGALDYRPNVEGVRWLADEIWPRVAAALPSARLHVVGRNPVADVVDAVHRCGAELHADVPDVRPWYWQAGVAVSPVRLGSGARNKILHAFACGAPLVSTSASIEGLNCVPGRDVLVADDAASFAEAVVATLSDTQGAVARAGHASELASGYTSRHAGDALQRLWERAAAASNLH